MFDAITDFFVSWMGLQSFVYIFLLGYLTLLIYFYGSEKWEKFSDFDKIGFSFLIGLAIWILLIRPLSSYLLFVWNTFFSFTSESYIFAPPLTQQWSTSLTLLFSIILFMGLLRILKANKPLHEVNDAFELFITVLTLLWVVVTSSLLSFAILLNYADYKIYSSYILTSLFPYDFIFILIFIFLFLVVHNKLFESFERVFSYIRLNKKFFYCIITVLFVVIGGSVLFSHFFFKPTIQDYGETIHSITNDSRLTIGYIVGYGNTSVPEELICKKYITKEYTLNTKRLSWVPIKPGFTLNSAKRWINGSTSKEYAIINKTYFIVNESRNQEINVTANGFKVIKLIRDKDYDSEIEDRRLGNQTEINFTIINKKPHTLNLGNIMLYLTTDYNLTSYTKTVGIDRVEGVDPKHIRIEADLASNQSGKVTLFLEEIEMNTTDNSNNQNNH